MDISDSGDGPAFNLEVVGQFNGGINQNENMENNDANRRFKRLVCIFIGILVCIILFLCGWTMSVTGTAQTMEEQWIWAWSVFVSMLSLALMIGACLMPAPPLPGDEHPEHLFFRCIVLPTLIIGALIFLAMSFMSMVAKAVIVAMTIFKQG